MTLQRYAHSQTVFGDEWNTAVNKKILMVGAGGIGCELLKNLVMFGFKDIEIVSFSFSGS